MLGVKPSTLHIGGRGRSASAVSLAGQREVQPPKPDDIRSYWSGIIGMEGHFDLSNPAIQQWCRLSFKGQYNAQPPDLGPGDPKAERLEGTRS